MIALCWSDRLTKKVYPNAIPQDLSKRGGPSVTVEDDVAVDFGDIIDIVEVSDAATFDGSEDSAIDLPGADGTTAKGSIDLTISVVATTVDLAVEKAIAVTSEVTFPSPEPEAASNPLDDFVDGLACWVGQVNTSPTYAREAIANLTRWMEQNNNKPRPATSVIEFPRFERNEPTEPRQMTQ